MGRLSRSILAIWGPRIPTYYVGTIKGVGRIYQQTFIKTMQDECYSLLLRKKLYRSLEELQVDLDEWLRKYNEERPHSGRYCYGKTSWRTFLDSKYLALEKDLSRGGDGSYTTTRAMIPVG
jgi:intein/homing endonuclease